LRKNNYDFVITREPGGTRISDQIRSILLEPTFTEMTDQAEVLLYAASRAQHVHQFIIPALQQNQIVLCDRFIDASVAYQGYGLGIQPEMVKQINAFASSSLVPNRTYLLDIPIQISQTRIRNRAKLKSQQELDRIEQKSAEYHEKVRNAFLSLAKLEPNRVLILDGTKDVAKLAHEIWSDFQKIVK